MLFVLKSGVLEKGLILHVDLGLGLEIISIWKILVTVKAVITKLFFLLKNKNIFFLQVGAQASLKFSFQRCGEHILPGVKSQVSLFTIMAISINTTNWLGLGFVPSSV